MPVELDNEWVIDWSPYCDSSAPARRTQEGCQLCQGCKIRCNGSPTECGLFQRHPFIWNYDPSDNDCQLTQTAVMDGYDFNGFDSPPLLDPQFSLPVIFDSPTEDAERSTDQVLQFEDPTLSFEISSLDSVSSMPLSHDFEPQAFVTSPPDGVYVPVKYPPFAHITPTQEAIAIYHDSFEFQDVYGREPTALDPFSPDEFFNCPPPEPTTSAFRLHVGSPALASAKRKIRTHAAKYFCSVRGCGRDFTTKQNLKNHLDAHAGIKRHACSACTRPFGLLHGLARHRKTCKVLAARPV